MLREDVRSELAREPFVPLRIQLKDGKTFKVPFREAAHLVSSGLLVFIGLKEGTHQAKGYDRFALEEIVRIEQRPKGKGGRSREKAS